MSNKIGPKHLRSLNNEALASAVKDYERVIDKALKNVGDFNGFELKIPVERPANDAVLSHLRKLYCEGEDPWAHIDRDEFSERNETIFYIVLKTTAPCSNGNWMDR